MYKNILSLIGIIHLLRVRSSILFYCKKKKKILLHAQHVFFYVYRTFVCCQEALYIYIYEINSKKIFCKISLEVIKDFDNSVENDEIIFIRNEKVLSYNLHNGDIHNIDI
jgi:hypothetical protein